MEAEPGPDSAGAAFPLLQVGLGGPDGGVVGHVVVGGEQLHLLPVRRNSGVNWEPEPEPEPEALVENSL